MGVIRTLLALSVLIVHAGGIFWLPLPSGMMAVQAFYIISGFYMGLVLSEKYLHKKKGYQLFISNRFLRIFPLYWVVLTMVFFISLFSLFFWNEPLVLQAFTEYHIIGFPFIYSIAVNILVLGQDCLMFMGLNEAGSAFFFTSDFHDTYPRMHRFLLIQPSWTITLEFTFYLLAPLLNRCRTSLIIVFIAISFTSRFVFYIHGFYNDPWFYRFFPFEIGFFLAGMLAYRIFARYRDFFSSFKSKNIIYLVVLVLLSTSGIWPGPYMVNCYLVYLLIFSSLPFIFSLTMRNKLDRRIGELSYPLYICHYPLLVILNSIELDFINKNSIPFLLLVVSLFCSVVLNRLVAKPIEKLRQSRV